MTGSDGAPPPPPSPSSPPARSFRVCEAPARDVGRGLLRLDSQDMANLGVETGDIVTVTGKRLTVARVMPAHAAQRRQTLVQMDGLLRVNAGAGLDEQVEIRPASATPARAVTLREVGTVSRPTETRSLMRLLDGIPMVAGDRLRAQMFGAQSCEFAVEATDPEGPVMVAAGTHLPMPPCRREWSGPISKRCAIMPAWPPSAI